jgi:ABC-2 type transport system ATP-binding protein
VSIVVEHLNKIFGKQKAVNDVSFSIASGEIVGFLGPNGAGKSTTMKMICGYIPPTSGGGTVCGIDFVEESLEVRKIIGYLPEHNPLYLDMFVKEYLQFMAGLSGVKNQKSSVNTVLDLTGLHPEKHKKIGQLSKGYRQRVGLAQALIHDPKVLILDEPTSGLDPNQVMEMRQVITNLGKEKTVLLSTHIMQEVEAMCQRVLIINKGQIIKDSPIHALQENFTTKTIVWLELGTNCNKELISQIEGIENVDSVGENRWKISSSSETIRQTISQFCLKHNLEILEMSAEKENLEDIFRKLTGHVGNI